MSNILALPQLQALTFVVSVDGDFTDPSIFFPADSGLVNPLDISGIRFVTHFRRPDDSQIMLALDTSDGSWRNTGTQGFLTPNALVSTRLPLFVANCTGDLFAIADGYQRNLCELNGPIALVIKGDTL